MDKCIIDYINNFSKIYLEQVAPQLEEFGNERKIAVLDAKKHSNAGMFLYLYIFVMLIIILSIPFSFCFMLTTINNFIVNLIGFIGIFILGFITILIVLFCLDLKMVTGQYTLQKRNLEESIKTKIMDIIMPAFGNFKWVKEDIIDEDLIINSQILPKFNNILNDDMFLGSYKNVSICLTETLLLNTILDGFVKLNLKYTTDDPVLNLSKEAKLKCFRDCLAKSYLHNNVFYGILISVKNFKSFKGHTVILSNNSKNYTKYDKVNLEDIKFSKQFKVYSTDQIEARYLLTPSVMERLKNIQNKFLGNSISCSFRDNDLLIAIPTKKDLFSIGNLDIPVTDMKQYKIFLDELISIFEIIEELKLYENTGL